MTRLLFDVTGLIQWYSYLKHPSGIQRFSERILQAEPIASFGLCTLVARGLGSSRFYRVEPTLISDLGVADRRALSIANIRRLFSDTVSFSEPVLLARDIRPFHAPYLVSSVSRLWRNKREEVFPQPDDVVIGLADFWCQRGHVECLVKLKQKMGVKLVHMIHDLFALGRGDWTHPYFGTFFKDRLETLAPFVDSWLTNSNFVAGQLREFLNNPLTSIDVVPMGWDKPGVEDSGTLSKYGLSRGNYFLHVGTLEPRKNLVSLIDAAQRAAEAAGDRAIPLVMVGRDGWRSAEIHSRLRQVNANVARWLPDVADLELPSIYQGARFTAVPSLAEGWGLAVQESLAQGVPCIASAVGGIPEVGAELVRYVDPHDVDAIGRAIADWCVNADRVMAARTAIRNRLQHTRLPTWDDAAQQVLKSALSARS